MELFTEADKALLEKYPLYSQDSKKAEAEVIIKYFLPGTGITFYVLEASPEGEDITFFGYIDGVAQGGSEYGYFTLSQLKEIQISVPIEDNTGKEIGLIPCKIERDLHLAPGTTIGELVPEVKELYED
jgi:hypothetical protein